MVIRYEYIPIGILIFVVGPIILARVFLMDALRCRKEGKDDQYHGYMGMIYTIWMFPIIFIIGLFFALLTSILDAHLIIGGVIFVPAPIIFSVCFSIDAKHRKARGDIDWNVSKNMASTMFIFPACYLINVVLILLERWC